ncbi:MAG TPA: hypothetical protein VLG46_15975, partial [Anaerolineae bacterium]|nr:hypothetical protein [Anaerolineae bacterium]
AKSGVIHLCTGIHAIHYFLTQEAAHVASQQEVGVETKMTLSFADSPIDSGGGASFNTARWMILNESAGGLALSTVIPSQAALHIGDLLGLKPDSAPNWGLAVVRWAKSANGDAAPLDIGAQMLAPSAQAVSIATAEHDTFEPALLLPELAALKQPASLICARGIYKPARSITLEVDGRRTNILLTRLLERTSSFERFQFSGF